MQKITIATSYLLKRHYLEVRIKELWVVYGLYIEIWSYAISGMGHRYHRCRLRSEIGCAEFGHFLILVPRAHERRVLVPYSSRILSQSDLLDFTGSP